MSATTKTSSMMMVTALVCLMTGGVSQAADLIDQEQPLFDQGGLEVKDNNNSHIVQSFVPAKKKLEAVVLNLGPLLSGDDNLTVGIYNVIGGAGNGGLDAATPTGTALAEVTVNTTALTLADGLLNDKFTFASPVDLSIGTVYAIQLTPGGGHLRIQRHDAFDNYSPGFMIRMQVGNWDFVNDFDTDAAFQTIWIPEPATLGLLTLGGLMLLRRSRRA